MASKFTKYGIAIIAAVLLIGVCAGAASAADIDINTFEEYNSTTFSGGVDGTYHIKGTWTVPVKELLVLNGDLTLNFTDFTGDFAGYLFDVVSLYGYTLDIVGLTMKDTIIVGDNDGYAGVICTLDGEDTCPGRLNFTDCHLENCSITGTYYTGGLIGKAYFENSDNNVVNINNCSLLHCDVRGYYSGGLISYSYRCHTSVIQCIIENSTVVGASVTGGIIGSMSSISGYNFNGYIEQCEVKNSLIYTSEDSVFGGTSGMVGSSQINNANLNFRGCNLTNSVIIGKNGVGGLYGFDIGRESINTTNCTVMNCTLRLNHGSSSGYIGGLVGSLQIGMYFQGKVNGSGNLVKNTAVYVDDNADSGSLTYPKENTGGTLECIADIHENFIHNTSYDDTITLYDVNGTQITDVGADIWYTFSYANAENESRSLSSRTVTSLGKYGTIEGYGMVPKYQVTYEASGIRGTLPTDATKYLKDEVVTVKESVAKDGYVFNGWYNESIGLKQPGESFSITQNMILQGNFTGNTTIVTYQNESGITYIEKSYVFNESVDLPSNPVKPGYYFLCWNITVGEVNYTFNKENRTYFDENGKWNYTGINETRLTVNASWYANTITLNLMDGYGAFFAARNETYGKYNATPVSSFPAKEGYTFTGWNVSDNPSVQLINATGQIMQGIDSYTDASGAWINGTLANGAELKLDAVFVPNITTVTFHTDTGTEDKLNTFALPINFSATPTKPGYVFTMWNVSSTGEDLNSSTYVKNGNWNYTGVHGGALDVYANWTLSPYVEVSDWEQLVAVVEGWTDTATMRTVVLTNTTNGAYKNATGTAGQYDGIPVTGNITIKPALNIGEIRIDGNQRGRLFYVQSGASLILAGNGTGGLEVTEGNCTFSSGGAITVSSGANLTLSENVRITNCSTSSTGGAVSVAGGGTFTMNKAGISGCRASDSGGAVYVYNGGTFTMNDSTIDTCWATNTGGGIYAEDNTICAMNGGSITNCSSKAAGGLYTYGSTLTDATISGNTASTGSGIISLNNSITLNGNTQITNNDFALAYVSSSYPSIICGSSFTGSVANITLYDGTAAENLSIWTAQTVVRNGAAFKNRFALSSQYAGYKLTERGSDLILGIDVPTNTIYAMILNASGNPVNVTLNSSSGTHIATKPLAAGETNATFTGLADGVYSLEGYLETAAGITGVSKLVTLKGGEGVYVELVFPQMNVTSTVIRDAESGVTAPNVVVDGLDAIAATVSPVAGKEIVIFLKATAENYNASNQDQVKLKDNISVSTSNADIKFMNFTLTKTTVDLSTGKTDSNTTITQPSTLITIYLEYDMNGRENLQVWRVHDGIAEKFRELTGGMVPADGYYARDGTRGVYIYAQNFSSYALSSSLIRQPSSGNSDSSTPNYGYTQIKQTEILSVNPTVMPTAAPSVTPTNTPAIPTAAPIKEQPTQKSPAPVAGLIAGLGIAALVLARLRK